MRERRRIAKAIAVSIAVCVGGVVLAAMGIGLIAASVMGNDNIDPTDQAAVIQVQSKKIIRPVIGCSLVFALAAFAAMAPRSGVGFIRSLSIIGCSVVAALWSVQPAFPKVSRPSEWFEVVVSAVAGLVATGVLVLVGEQKKVPCQTDTADHSSP